MENNPEEILEFSDWMGIPIESYRVTLDRFRRLLLDEIQIIKGHAVTKITNRL
jgi:hypothetical protein